MDTQREESGEGLRPVEVTHRLHRRWGLVPLATNGSYRDA
jgi:hypothetical protein